MSFELFPPLPTLSPTLRAVERGTPQYPLSSLGRYPSLPWGESWREGILYLPKGRGNVEYLCGGNLSIEPVHFLNLTFKEDKKCLKKQLRK
jgi:hypothetical protein